MKGRKKPGIFKQIWVLVIVVVVIAGLFTYSVQYRLTTESVKSQTAALANSIATDVRQSVFEYPAYKWLLRYWYEEAENLDIEYDVDYNASVQTRKKNAQLSWNNPSFRARYATTEEVEALSPEDQKLFAEIAYSWLITRINGIKKTYDVDYLFCVLTDTEAGAHPYQEQFFLFSGADEGQERGREYLQAYTLGTTVSVAENQEQMNVMRNAVERAREGRSEETTSEQAAELAMAGDYVDHYSYLGMLGDKAVLVGLTYDFSDLRADIRKQTWKGVGFAVLYELLLLQLFVWFLHLFGVRPLKKILGNIRLYTETKDSETINENLSEILSGKGAFALRKNEIGELAEDVGTLAREIDDYTAQIEQATAASERIGTELALAARIQGSMLPEVVSPYADHPMFELDALMKPAREVGGDFYDFFMVDDDHLAMVMADVSGKGVPAALFMMASRIQVHNMTLMEKEPAAALMAVNREISRSNPEQMFVTVWLGILELSTGILTAANAGHEYPAIKAAGGKFELLKDKHGFVIGGFEEAKYQSYQLQLQPGARIFVYTDGVAEATSADTELFGTARMIDALNEVADASAKEIIAKVQSAVDAFTGEAEQFDDLTMLCLEYKGPHE